MLGWGFLGLLVGVLVSTCQQKHPVLSRINPQTGFLEELLKGKSVYKGVGRLEGHQNGHKIWNFPNLLWQICQTSRPILSELAFTDVDICC